METDGCDVGSGEGAGVGVSVDGGLGAAVVVVVGRVGNSPPESTRR